MITATPEAYELIHEGARTLAAIEANGMRIDVPYLHRAIGKVGERITSLTAELKNDEVYAAWRKTFGVETKLGSRVQLGKVLFDIMGYERQGETVGGRAATDEETLSKLQVPFVKNYLRIEKLKKLRSTYLNGILREVVDGFLRPVFNLHTVVTFRSSSDSPNFQNLPIRDPELAKIIRRAFIPRDDHVLLEIDLKANEVRVACAYCRDERLIRDTLYGDMHRDMAAELFFLPKDQVPKNVRNTAKNCFVFAEFFGDYYIKVAQYIWEQIGKYELATQDGISLFDHLKSKGFYELGSGDPKQPPRNGTYEQHVKAVEDRFWGVRYRTYDAWRDDWYAAYVRRGGFKMLTGFVVHGVYGRNEVLNSPIQGSAFHCLLWVLIELQKWLRKNKMRTMIVGQIHDSMELDAHKDEVQDVVAEALRLIRVAVQIHWPWLVVPLEAEVEIAETNWYEKRPYECA